MAEAKPEAISLALSEKIITVMSNTTKKCLKSLPDKIVRTNF